jgi:hypothetical protein
VNRNFRAHKGGDFLGRLSSCQHLKKGHCPMKLECQYTRISSATSRIIITGMVAQVIYMRAG